MKNLTMGYQVLLAVVLGICTGLFFGPLTGALSPIGSAYTMLLQMAVLPYITFSLIHGLGSITPEIGKKIFKSGWAYLLTLWTLIFILIYLLANLIPQTLSPLFQSSGSNEIESEFAKNFLANLIPQNPFFDILNNVIPAVAVFGLISGFALMHVSKKEPLIGALERINQTIEKILSWLGTLSPIGAYVYISIAFGTIYLEDFLKLQVYIFSSIFCCLFVTFWILPTLISTMTPLTYKDALKAFRFVCLLPFVTGLSTAALPFLTIYLKKLSLKHETHTHFRETSQTILPIAYSFGQIGNALILFFILFLSYYYRQPLTDVEKTLLSFLTVPLSIGSSTGNLNSILFLIDQLGFPEGASKLFFEIKPITINFQVLMSIASVLTLILLTIYSYYGLIRFQWKHLIFRMTLPLVGFALILAASKSIFHPSDLYENLYLKLKISDAIPHPIESEVLKEGQQGSPRAFANTMIPEVFKQIVTTKVLKVGIFPNSIPYCYYNYEDELVGYDVSYAYELARDLECKLQFVPFSFDRLASDINEGVFDIGMSSIIMNEERLVQMVFTYPYLADNIVLVVPRDRKKEFLQLKDAQAIRNLNIGAGGALYEIAMRHFPNAKITNMDTIEPFLKKEFEAILWSKTSAVIWCISHPEFITIDYGTKLGKGYFGYPIRLHATDFGFFLNTWLTLKENSGFKKNMENYWIHGISPKQRKPRWSILRNVLNWE
jgi:proton glutamate symport protein